jgi:hypothetical protein
LLSQDIKIPIIGANFVKDILWPVPLIKHRLNHALVSIKPKTNQMSFLNYILRPRADLLFSVEYRRLRTFEVSGAPATADQVGLAAGFLF